VADPRLAEQARANDQEHCAVGADDAFADAVIDLVLRYQRLFARLQDNPAFRREVKAHIRLRVYGRQREAVEAHIPAGEGSREPGGEYA